MVILFNSLIYLFLYMLLASDQQLSMNSCSISETLHRHLYYLVMRLFWSCSFIYKFALLRV